MGVLQQTGQTHHRRPHLTVRRLPLDSYGVVLLLIILDYIVVSIRGSSAWGAVGTVVLLGTTLLFVLRTSQARRIWIILATANLVASTFLTLLSIILNSTGEVTRYISTFSGTLLLLAPFVIAHRISRHKVVTTETVLGAVCVYLLLGFSFAFIFSGLAAVSSTPFFIGKLQATTNDFLFFSFTTLTTVGYGNLVPAGTVGQTFAMLEALSGQIYLVIVVARLVSLWGQARPTSDAGTERRRGLRERAAKRQAARLARRRQTHDSTG